MSRRWSELVGDRFQLRLPADLAAWLDDQRWRITGGAEFHEPLPPEQIVDPEPGTIWASFMSPDTLPLISNGYGDWLCLRATPTNEVAEIIFWTHDGGDWMPFGDGLAEALIFDAAIAVLYPPRPEFDSPPPDEQRFLHAEWARDWLAQHTGKTIAPFWRVDHAAGRTIHSVLTALIRANIAATAARRNLILDHLDTKLKSVSSATIAQKIGIPWQPDYVSWLFDVGLMPAERQQFLSRHFNIPIEQLASQDWRAAELLALEVLKSRRDLGWAYDVAGWAAERRGDIGTAVEFYQQGLKPSLFADNTIKFRTHWFANGFGKFSASRLSDLRSRLPKQLLDDDYLKLFLANENDTLRDRIRDHWLAAGATAIKSNRPADAYCCYLNAGWDMGLNDLESFPEIFSGLAASARAANFPALAAIAELHQSRM